MAKVINHRDLAELVYGLIVCPDTLGELDERETYQRFLEAIAETVCAFTGGELSGVDMPEFCSDQAAAMDGLTATEREDMTSWSVCVRQDDSLPDNGGVWAYYDTEANSDWAATDVTAAQAATLRASIQSTMLSSLGVSIPNPALSNAQVKIERDIPIGPVPSVVTMAVSVAPDTVSVDYMEGNDCIATVYLDVSKNVPRASFSRFDNDVLFHAHAAHYGFVLAVDNRTDTFERAPMDSFSYEQPNSLLIRANI